MDEPPLDPRVHVAGLRSALKQLTVRRATAMKPETVAAYDERITEVAKELMAAEQSLITSSEDDDYDDVPEESGAELLEALSDWATRFVHFTDEDQSVAVAAWSLHTWATKHFDYSPRLFVRSFIKGSGKTRVLEVLRPICRRSWATASTSAAALYRSMEDNATVLVDELDTVYGHRDATSSTEALRGVINAGYSRQVSLIQRCDTSGAGVVVETFDAFGPLAMAGIGKHLPDTILDRSIIITLERAKRRSVQRFRTRLTRAEGEMLGRRCAAWVERNCVEIVATADRASSLLPDVSDRAQDVWEPLMQLAVVAGGDWPVLVGASCRALNAHRERIDQSDTRIEALESLQAIFEETSATFLPTHTLAWKLDAIEYSPFADWNHGDGIRKNQLAGWMRKNFDLLTVKGSYQGERVNGYNLAELTPLFDTYLSRSHGGDSDTTSDTSSDTEPVSENAPELVSELGVQRRELHAPSKRAVRPANPSKRPVRRPTGDE